MNHGVERLTAADGVADTPDPLGYSRQAMQQRRTTWATRGPDPEPADRHVL
ncbi:MAG TPA: hypothetical protein VF361_09580 [Candidatus Limnocylindrales bacterium]